jgi:sigma-B regulation protein RsbQ
MGAATDHAARVLGAGEPVFVLAHGIGGDQTQWAPIAEHLARSGRVITFDLAGSGACDPAVFSTTRHSSIIGFADDLAAVCADLRARGAVYVGHSMSGMAGALAAAADPGLFTRMITIAASARYVDDPDTGYVGGFDPEAIEGMLEAIRSDFALWSAGFAPYVMRNSDRPELALEFTRTLQRYPANVAYTVMRAAFTSDFRSYMPRVRVPTLVLQTPADPAVPVAAAAWLADAMAEGRLQLLHGEGHFPHVAEPDEVIDAIEAFLQDEEP